MIEQALVDTKTDQFKFWLNNEDVNFNIFQSMKQPNDMGMMKGLVLRH